MKSPQPIVGIMIALLAGCSSNGQKMDRSMIATLERGKTTRTQVEATIGPPTSLSIMPDGKRLALYLYSESQMHPADYVPYVMMFWSQSTNRQQNLQIVYTNEGVLQDYEYTDDTKTTTGIIGGWSKTENAPNGQK